MTPAEQHGERPLVRRLLAALAWRLAVGALSRAGETKIIAWKIRWKRRSEFWADVECWLSGLGSWRALRGRRRRARIPLSRSIITGPAGPRRSY